MLKRQPGQPLPQWHGLSRSWRICLSLGAAFTMCFAATAQAQTLSEEEVEQLGVAEKPSEGNWNIVLGPGLADHPVYPGASTNHFSFVPLFSIRYRDWLFLASNGLGASLVHWKGFRAGPVLGFEGGRKQSSDPALDGLSDIDASLTAGGFVSYQYGHWQIYGTARQAVTHAANGLTALVRLDYRAALIPGKLDLFIGPEALLADGQANQTWFGISPDQSAQSGLPAFTPTDGFRDVGAHATLTYDLSDHIFLHAFGEVKELTGDVSRSPIVQNKTQSLAGLGVAYRF